MTIERPEAACDWCGLPVPGRWSVRTAKSADPAAGATGTEYCCFGCRFAAQVAGESGESGQVRWTLTRLGIGIFFTMNVMVFTMALWSHDIYEIDQSDAFAATLSGLFRWLCLLGGTPVLFLLGVPIAASAWIELLRGRITTDLLVVIGVVAAFGYSVFSVLTGLGHTYFEVSCMVLVMITLGRWLEASGRLKTGEVLESLDKLLPEHARLLVEAGERVVACSELAPGDLIRVAAGERIPTDGILERSAVSIDQQILTGESAPVVREPGELVASGAVAVDGDAVVRVTRSVNRGTLAQMLDAVRTARASRGRFQRLADAIAVWFVPMAAIVAVGAAVVRGQEGSVGDAILCGLAVILIACPCALGLATSVAVWAAMYRAAQRGVLFRSGEVLERLADVKAVRFDKTGTLTTGLPRLTGVFCCAGSVRGEVGHVAVALAERSSHAFSRAIVASQYVGSGKLLSAARSAAFSASRGPDGGQVESVSGRGLTGQLDVEGVIQRVWLGSERFLAENGCDVCGDLESELHGAREAGRPVVLIGWGGRVRGLFVFAEELRVEARQAVGLCRGLQLDLGVLSGDSSLRSDRLASWLGIAAQGTLLPEDKLAAIQTARQSIGPVLMVGDGINDGPALAGADVAASLGSGTDLSRDASGVCLLRDDLRCIPWMIALARQTRRIIRQNLFWAFTYNGIGMALAATGLLNPVFAALIMFGSSAIVLANSRRLVRFEAPFEALFESDNADASLGHEAVGHARKSTSEAVLT